MSTLFQSLSRRPCTMVLATALAVVLVGCAAGTPEAPQSEAVQAASTSKVAQTTKTDENAQAPVTALLSPAAASPEKVTPAVPEKAPTADPDDPPPPPPLLGVRIGDDAFLAHKALGPAYNQIRWTSEPPVLRRQYTARNPENALQQVELETCQTDDRVVAVRVTGPSARAVYEAAHRKFAFRYVERARDVAGMDPGPGPDMPFSRLYAEDVVLSLITTPNGGEVLLESQPMRKQCTETVSKARQHMQDYFLEQDQARTTRHRDSL